ncbi:MmgE/PrpD family protein [Candidimonas nitroreducens]|uniref:2-methylcitrate dehydratase n=1 Tax=Candidimonas nitroreducens TaxID=683354 RepID=A0A225M813_9BURK|nr:MmgE/PrpD family protein [Candidimonas nitroreducens]OWT57467.1 hypothetical protein CEY11_16295 [Candidimonas nitroreducens]
MLANDFGGFIASTTFDDLPVEVIEAAKLRVLDLLGAALAGYQLGCHANLLPLVQNPGPSTAWGVGTPLSVRDATLLNTFMSHALYIEDGSRYTGGHPACVVIPAALALAESRQASGRELIAAVAVGYEIFLRLGRALYPSLLERGFQSTAVIGAAAAASACARLMDLSPAQSTDSLAIACTLGVGFKESSKSPTSQPLQVARSAESGVLATLFAAQGVPGAESILENGFLPGFAAKPDPVALTDELGKRFSIAEVYTKIHGGCRGNHAPVDLIARLTQGERLVAGRIAAIKIRVDSATFANEIALPANGKQAQYSVAFAVAAQLVYGESSVFRYTDAALGDPEIQTLMACTEVEADPKLDLAFPDKRGASIKIVMHDGSCRQGEIDNALGEPEHPFSHEQIEAKFLSLTEQLPDRRGKSILACVQQLDVLDDISALCSQLDLGHAFPHSTVTSDSIKRVS